MAAAHPTLPAGSCARVPGAAHKQPVGARDEKKRAVLTNIRDQYSYH